MGSKVIISVTRQGCCLTQALAWCRHLSCSTPPGDMQPALTPQHRDSILIPGEHFFGYLKVLPLYTLLGLNVPVSFNKQLSIPILLWSFCSSCFSQARGLWRAQHTPPGWESPSSVVPAGFFSGKGPSDSEQQTVRLPQHPAPGWQQEQI